MASLTLDDTKHIAKLAKLDLTPKEEEKFTTQLSKVVDLMTELNEIDTQNVEPTAQTTGLINITREDTIDETRTLSEDEALSGKDDTQNGFFVVPQILTKK